MKPRFVELKRNVLDESGDTNLVVQAGTKLLVLSDEETHLIVEKLDQSVSFPVDYDDVEDTEMFQVNDVCFDTEMQEHVLITNGTCVLDHTDSDAYKNAHEGLKDCVYKPCEAIAIRCIGTEVIGATDSRVPVCAWTYRGVNPDHLRKSEVTREQFSEWMEACPTGRV
jgi:hypothetical protein